MKIFVTGATGFVGRAFCQAALAHGHEVLGLCLEGDTHLPEGCTPVTGSLEHFPWKEIEAFAPEAALHLAWIATPGIYLTSPDNAVFVEQSKAVLAGLMDRGVRHVAGVGTCIEYAPSTQPLRETESPLAPSFPYSRAKVQLFEWLRDECKKRATAWTWFRIFYPYGVGEHASRLPSHIIRQLQRREYVDLRTPNSIKDYVYVSDVAEALCYGLESAIAGPINLGSGQGTSVWDLAQTIAGLLHVDPALIRAAEVPGADPTPVVVADVSRIRSTGWTPSTTLGQGLQKLIAFLSSQDRRYGHPNART